MSYCAPFGLPHTKVSAFFSRNKGRQSNLAIGNSPHPLTDTSLMGRVALIKPISNKHLFFSGTAFVSPYAHLTAHICELYVRIRAAVSGLIVTGPVWRMHEEKMPLQPGPAQDALPPEAELPVHHPRTVTSISCILRVSPPPH